MCQIEVGIVQINTEQKYQMVYVCVATNQEF